MRRVNLPDPGAPPAAEPLRILQLEDSADDAELELAQLRRDGLAFTSRCVDTRAAFLAALEDFRPQLVLADYKLPGFDGGSALALVLERHPQIPVIVVSGALGDEAAVELLRQGARDFVLKDRMGRLGAAVRNALVESAERTRRRQAEQALQDSERRFRNLIENAADIVSIARADGTIVYISPAAVEVTGYSPQELIGRNYFELVLPEDLELARSQVATLMSQPGVPVHLEWRVRHKDGSVRYTETVARNLAHLPGIEGIVVNVRDVTQRKNAEARLRLAHLLIEQSPSVLFRWSATAGWPVVYVSDNVRQWGYAPDALLAGKPPYAQLIHPDDLARVAAEVAAHSASGATQFAQEYRIVKPSGEMIWVDDRTTVERDLAGVPVFFQGVVMDITARKSAEQALRDNEQTLRSITGAAMDAVIVMDNDGRIAFWNEAAERHLGFSRSQALGKELHTLMAPERYREGFRKAFAHFRDSGQGTVIGKIQELDALRADGTELPVELSVSAVQLKGRWCAVGILRDISERREAEAEKQALLDRARAQLAAVTQMTASAALAAGEVETLAREVTELAAGVSGAERANIWLFNDDETELHCVDLYEATPARHSSGMVLRQSEFENEFRALKAAPFVDADDALSDPRTAGYVETYIKPLRIRSLLDTVVEVGGRHLGLLSIEHVDRTHRWAPDEIAFAGQLADRLGLCLLNRSRRELTTELQEAQRLASLGNWRLDLRTGKTFCSEQTYRIFGMDPTGAPLDCALDPEPILPAGRERLAAARRRCVESGASYDLDLEIVRANGMYRWITVRGEAQRDAAGTIVALRGTVQDITERRLQEAVLRRTARALRALSRGDSALLHAQTEQQLYEDMCRAIVDTGGYKLAWVGRPEVDAARAVTPLAMAGDGSDYVSQLRLSRADTERGREPVGRCIRLGTVQIVRDIAADPLMKPWHKLARDHGYRSVVALPLFGPSGTFGSLSIYAAELSAFDDDEIRLLKEMAGNLAYGVMSLRARRPARGRRTGARAGALSRRESERGVTPGSRWRAAVRQSGQRRAARRQRRATRRSGARAVRGGCARIAGVGDNP